MNAAEKVIAEVIRREGSKYTNYPADRGGPTKWGITQATLSAFLGRPASISDVQNLTEELATRIYRENYIVKPGFVHVLALSELVGAELVDSGVNVGPARAAKWLQTALNAFNNRGKHYADIAVDGMIGSKTLVAMREFFSYRGKAKAELVLFRALNALQGAHYLNLVERSESQEQFAFGWFSERVQ